MTLTIRILKNIYLLHTKNVNTGNLPLIHKKYLPFAYLNVRLSYKVS